MSHLPERLPAALLPVLLVLLIVPALGEGQSAMAPATVPAYYAGLFGEESAELTVYYKDGDTQIPYFDADTVVLVMDKVYREGYGDYSKDPDYDLRAVTGEGTVTFVRENGYTMAVDAEADTIAFRDYDMFVSHSFDTTVVEFTHSTGYDDEGRPAYLQRCADMELSRYGDELTVDLKPYGIDLLWEDGRLYLPAQTVTDLLLGDTYTIFLYNGEACFFLNYETYMDDLADTTTGYAALFYAAQGQTRGQALIEYTYHELCLTLDLFYGFRESRGITSFDDYFE